MKKLLLITIFFITSCGYETIYLNNNLKNFEFYKVNIQGEKDVNKQILNSLLLKENPKNDNLSELSLSSTFNVEEISKNSKGQTETYRSSLLVTLKVIKNKKTLKSKVFSDEFTYNKKDNKFELTEYQADIKKQLISGIMENLILFLNME